MIYFSIDNFIQSYFYREKLKTDIMMQDGERWSVETFHPTSLAMWREQCGKTDSEKLNPDLRN
jgi:hypothetical protein